VNAGSAYGTQGAGHIRVVTGCFAEDSKAEEVFTRMAKALEQLGDCRTFGEKSGRMEG
jgi:bifunctional pyridoxal-dependent enzyme with beta-cystathionase and maltose regulon repressor activities